MTISNDQDYLPFHWEAISGASKQCQCGFMEWWRASQHPGNP
jgi:hypothetical protein